MLSLSVGRRQLPACGRRRGSGQSLLELAGRVPCHGPRTIRDGLSSGARLLGEAIISRHSMIAAWASVHIRAEYERLGGGAVHGATSMGERVEDGRTGAGGAQWQQVGPEVLSASHLSGTPTACPSTHPILLLPYYLDLDTGSTP